MVCLFRSALRRLLPRTLRRQLPPPFPRGEAEKLHARRDDLGALAFAAVVLGFELARAEPPFT